ncbi:MAG: polysaccharide biosynthesis C-terminal domain-containing protein, partial [Clostridia bacterium]|nr:polysaccharide biosynthesis C-terminal domain-containing protein [Clostridia bacterium]
CNTRAGVRLGALGWCVVEKSGKIKRKYTLFTGKQLLWLILPIVIEQIFSTSLGMFDSIMISNIPTDGANASLAVGNVDYINNLIIQLFSAFATGGAIITSQYLGAQDDENANKSAKQMLMLVILISLGIGGLCLALNYPLLKLFYGEVSGAVFGYQQLYFFVTAASFPFIGLFNACAALLRVQRKSLFTMISAAISCLLNVGLNALFLFVAKMGVLGAGLATLVCRAIPAVFMLVLLANKKNTVCVKLFEKFRFDGKMLKKILRIAIPSGIESCLFQLGKLMTNTFVNAGCYVQPVLDGAGNPVYKDGVMQTVNLQANGNTIANQINNIASVVGGGVGTSCLTVIGQAVGTGDEAQCRHYMKRMFLLSYIANGICCGIILACVPFIVNMYGFAAEAKEIGKHCLYFCLCFQFFTYPLSFTTPAILKATSDVKYVMFSAVASMFIMRVGLAFLLTTDKIAGLPKLGAMGYWIGMCSDWVLRSVLFLTRLLTGRWKRASGLIKETAAEGQTAELSDGVLADIDGTVGQCSEEETKTDDKENDAKTE